MLFFALYGRWERGHANLGRGGSVERFYKQAPDNAEEQFSLLYVKSKGQPYSTLRRAAERVWKCVRGEDAVLLLGNAFLVMLPKTPLANAQAVAQRIQLLLADREYELRVVSGDAARTLMQRARVEQAALIKSTRGPIESPAVLGPQPARSKSLPYLAFLSQYPSIQLLQLVPYEIAYRYHCVPVGAERGVLTLATCEQLQADVVSHLQQVTQRGIFQVRCECDVISEVLRYWQCMGLS